MSFAGFMAVGVGGVLGCWLRWALNVFMNSLLPSLPLGTLTANLLGGFVMGLAIELFDRQTLISPTLRLFLMTGFLGGLTTFSTFSAEMYGWLSRKDLYGGAIELCAHVVGSTALTFAGVAAVRWIVGRGAG